MASHPCPSVGCDAWEAWIEGYKELYDELRKFTVPA